MRKLTALVLGVLVTVTFTTGCLSTTPQENRPPDAVLTVTSTTGWSFSSHQEFHPERQMHFDASDSTDPDGDELTFSWQFGDGFTAPDNHRMSTYTESAANYTYHRAGTYVVNVTAFDGHGHSDTASLIVVIDNPEEITIDDEGIWIEPEDPVLGDHNGSYFVNITMRNLAPFDISIEYTLFYVQAEEGTAVYGWDGDKGVARYPTNWNVLSPNGTKSWTIFFSSTPGHVDVPPVFETPPPRLICDGRIAISVSFLP